MKFKELINHVEENIKDGPVLITWGMLPAQKLCEDFADALSEGYVVRVNRSGTGNAKHTGWLGGCSVNSIEVLRKTNRAPTGVKG